MKNFKADYYQRQFREPYRSTIAFADWLEASELLQKNQPAENKEQAVVDFGAGMGEALYYLGQRFHAQKFIGLELEPELVETGNNLLQATGANNCLLIAADMLANQPGGLRNAQGCISMQTISWMPGYADSLRAMHSLQPHWLAFSSLFYDGPVNTRTVIEEFPTADRYGEKKEFHYNTYSLPLFRLELEKLGYKKIISTPFHIDIDLPQPELPGMRTYTEKTTGGKRLQISGPLLMNWHFVAAIR